MLFSFLSAGSKLKTNEASKEVSWLCALWLPLYAWIYLSVQISTHRSLSVCTVPFAWINCFRCGSTHIDLSLRMDQSLYTWIYAHESTCMDLFTWICMHKLICMYRRICIDISLYAWVSLHGSKCIDKSLYAWMYLHESIL